MANEIGSAESFLDGVEAVLLSMNNPEILNVEHRRPLPGSRAYARDELNRIARLYLANPHVRRVELFGSFARGEGNSYSDYDLIVVVEDYDADAWLDAMYDRGASFNNDDAYKYKAYQRWEAAFSLLHVAGQSVWHKSDVFLFPPDWRSEEELDRLQMEGCHDDEDFMRNIARDAITFDEITGSFPWPA